MLAIKTAGKEPCDLLFVTKKERQSEHERKLQLVFATGYIKGYEMG